MLHTLYHIIMLFVGEMERFEDALKKYSKLSPVKPPTLKAT